MYANGQQWVLQARNMYYQYDKDRNGVLKKKEFKKAMQGKIFHCHLLLKLKSNGSPQIRNKTSLQDGRS